VDAGILYAPDYVINAGGVIHAWGVESLGWDLETVEARLAGIGDSLTEIYRSAEAESITTEAAAERLARSRLSAS
jgi:glutamate dehydrogenase/leucine dehydrogenase